jgi:hypothetical protein
MGWIKVPAPLPLAHFDRINHAESRRPAIDRDAAGVSLGTSPMFRYIDEQAFRFNQRVPSSYPPAKSRGYPTRERTNSQLPATCLRPFASELAEWGLDHFAVYGAATARVV